MSRVADGATTRKERIMEMLKFIQSFGREGVRVRDIWIHMEYKFGLKWGTTQGYLANQTISGLIHEYGQRVFINEENLEKLLRIMEPDVNPGVFDWWRNMSERDAPDTHTHSHTKDLDQTDEHVPPHNEEAEKKSEREIEREKSRPRPRLRHVWDPVGGGQFQCARCGIGPFSRSQIRRGGFGDCRPKTG